MTLNGSTLITAYMILNGPLQKEDITGHYFVLCWLAFALFWKSDNI